VRIHDGTKSRTTYYYANSGIPGPVMDPQCGFKAISPEANPVVAGEEPIFGYKTVIIQTRTGPYENSVWKAPELDCATLKMTESRRDTTGTIDGKYELQGVSLTAGPPAPRLFDLPADYAEMSPSQMYVAIAQKSGRPASDSELKRLRDTEDRRYSENHLASGR